MPTLNIEGQSVNVDDSFLKLSPEQQNATVDEISKSLPSGVNTVRVTPHQQAAAPNLGMQGQILHGMPIIGPAMEKAVAGAGALFGQGTYAGNLAKLQGGIEQYQAENPVKSAVGNVLGAGLALGPAGATNIGGRALGLVGENFATRAAQGALGGAGINAADAALRGENPVTAAAVGGGIGGALPIAGAGASALGRGVKSALQPLFQGGQEARANQILAKFAEGGPIIPEASPLQGAQPTLAAATGNPGLARLERSIRSQPGDITNQFVARDQANQEARNSLAGMLRGDELSLEADKATRAANAEANIASVFPAGQPPVPAQSVADVVASLDKVLASPAGKRDAVVSGLNNLRSKLVLENPRGLPPSLETDPAQLYGVRKAAGDMMKDFTSSSGKLASKELIDFQHSLDRLLGENAPGYPGYMQQFAAESRPIDRQTLLQKASVTDKNGNIALGKLDNTIKSIERMRIAGGANAGKSITEQEFAQLKAIREDMRMEARAKDLGRGPGSDTAQNLVSGQALGKLLGKYAGSGLAGAGLGYVGDLAEGNYLPGSRTMAGALLASGLRNRLNRGQEEILAKVASKLLDPAAGVRAIQAAAARPATSGIVSRVTNPILARALMRSLAPPTANEVH